jgi:anionic cell wall polymer biosynthesis LytR-Cps2A-Psr (LCP) family protein
MSLITWIVIVVIILAVIGIGWQAFISGVFKGVKKLGITPSNPAIKNVTEKARQFINNVTNGK